MIFVEKKVIEKREYRFGGGGHFTTLATSLCTYVIGTNPCREGISLRFEISS